MRMSDWSADGCSSDLDRQPQLRHDQARRRRPGGDDHAQPARTAQFDAAGDGRRYSHGARLDGCARGDRKSVVEGKSVSVRVDVWGWRCLKKITRKKVRYKISCSQFNTINFNLN